MHMPNFSIFQFFRNSSMSFHELYPFLIYAIPAFEEFQAFCREFVCLFWFFNCLQIETDRPKTVITTDHRTHGILHPAVIEVPSATRQRLYERTHRFPCGRAQTIRTTAIDGDPFLSFMHGTGMFDGILILRHQVRINGLPNRCDAHFVQIPFDWFSTSVHDIQICCKITNNF